MKKKKFSSPTVVEILITVDDSMWERDATAPMVGQIDVTI
jgi:hypothetical protein